MKRWILKQLGILGKLHKAELNMIERIRRLDISGDTMDDITEILMEELSKVSK